MILSSSHLKTTFFYVFLSKLSILNRTILVILQIYIWAARKPIFARHVLGICVDLALLTGADFSLMVLKKYLAQSFFYFFKYIFLVHWYLLLFLRNKCLKLCRSWLCTKFAYTILHIDCFLISKPFFAALKALLINVQ